mgnify:CR=1 FL=1
MITKVQSCGVVGVKKVTGTYQVLFCKSRKKGHLSLPKGHKEPGETDIQTALRELMEETGHTATRFWSGTDWVTSAEEALLLGEPTYSKGQEQKSVKFFLAEIEKVGEIQDTQEIEEVSWFEANEHSGRLLCYPEVQEFFNSTVLRVLQDL